MKQVRLIKQVMMLGLEGAYHKEADLTVGKVYDMRPNRRNDGFYVITDINTIHYFDSLDSPADESGFKSSDYWELVE